MNQPQTLNVEERTSKVQAIYEQVAEEPEKAYYFAKSAPWQSA